MKRWLAYMLLELRHYSDLSRHIKEPQNGIYCLYFLKNDKIWKLRPCFVETCSVLSVGVLSVSYLLRSVCVVWEWHGLSDIATLKVLAHWVWSFLMYFFIFVILSHQNACYGCENAENRNWSKFFLWRMKVMEALCKRDWHNVRLYLFFNV